MRAMSTTLFPMPFMLAMALSLCCATVARAVESKPEAPRIAVLRLEDTLMAFKLYTGGMDKLKQVVAEGQVEIKKMEEHLADLESKLQVMKEDSKAFADLKMDFELTRQREKMMVERGNLDIARQRAALVKDSYATLRGNLQVFCQERGIKLVHLAPNPEINANSNMDINQQLFAQSVLYFDPSLDITDAFIQYLNERWIAESTKEPVSKDAPAKDAPAKDATPKDPVSNGTKEPAPAPAPPK